MTIFFKQKYDILKKKETNNINIKYFRNLINYNKIKMFREIFLSKF